MNSQNRIPKTIYLDWNVFQDLINNRKCNRLSENITAAKQKGFSTPYSYAHMSDLSRCSNTDYVDADLRHVEIITEKKYIHAGYNAPYPQLQIISPRKILEDVKSNIINGYEKQDIPQTQLNFKVAIEKIPPGNIIIPHLKKYNDYMCDGVINSLVSELIENGLDSPKLQRDFRNSLAEIIKIGDPAVAGITETPFYKYLFASKKEIEENFPSILEFILNMTGKSIATVSEQEKFSTSYGIIDFFPIFKEKISKRNNMNNMLNDALHVFLASKCSYLICGDAGLIEKAKLLYRVFKIPTRVYDVDTFITKVEF